MAEFENVALGYMDEDVGSVTLDGSTLKITLKDGTTTFSVDLSSISPTISNASKTTKGIVQIGDNISVTDGVISVAAPVTKTSELTNDSGYITNSSLPTKTSDLTNDSGYITNSVSNLTNYYTKTVADGKYALSTDIPTATSDLTNDSGFITNSVSDLTNYYTSTAVDNLISNLKKASMQVVTTLPTTGEEGIIYLVGSASPYEMYIWENSAYISLGSTEVDLTNYVKKTDIATASAAGVVKPVAKTSAMTQSVGVDSNGLLYTTPAPEGATYTAGNGLSLSDNAFSIDTNVTMDLSSAQTITGKKTFNATTYINSDYQLFKQVSSLIPSNSNHGFCARMQGDDSVWTAYGLSGIYRAYKTTSNTYTYTFPSESGTFALTSDITTYTLPTATSTTLGGVMPVSKTSAMTQSVGVDSSGLLYTIPAESYTLPTATSSTLGGVKPSTSTTSQTEAVGVDSTGVLYTKPIPSITVTENDDGTVNIAIVNG